MIRKFITKAQDWADGKLRRLAGRISPDMRVAIILVTLVAFGSLSVYMTVSSIYRIGRNDGKELGIEHIRRLQLPNDSIINPFESGMGLVEKLSEWLLRRERKAAHLRADNRASPTASLKRERKEPPGKRQTGETGRRKPPGRRIRM